MALNLSVRLLPTWSPIIATVRTRTRTPNLKHPAIPHFARATVLKLVEPIYKDPLEGIPPKDLCLLQREAVAKITEEVNPYEQILANEFRERFMKAKLVAIFHMIPMKATQIFAARVQLNKMDLVYIKHNNTIMRLAFEGTKYEPLLHLYQSTNCTFIGDNPDVAKLLKLQKKIPGLILLAGVVAGRLMSVADLNHFAKLPPLPTLHAQLVSTLNTPAQLLAQNLTACQMELSSSLTRYVDQDKKDVGGSADTTEPSDPSQ